MIAISLSFYPEDRLRIASLDAITGLPHALDARSKRARSIARHVAKQIRVDDLLDVSGEETERIHIESESDRLDGISDSL